jgi:phenylalanyl-tRNA synthetase beta chain
MKASLKWINDYLDRPVTPVQIDETLTRQGLPIDSTVEVGSDVMLDVEVTSNRTDCLSMLGVAREIGAGLERHLKAPGFDSPDATGPDLGAFVSVENQATELCPIYTARLIKGVKVGPSPAWLVERLTTIGLRSINNVVDVTNFVLFETGQPLHAFDFAKVAGGKIIVRRAMPGESFIAIDGTKHELATKACPEMLVIADAQKPVAIAGVMGGKESEVTGATVDVLLEAAAFAQLCVRKTSRALKLASDSSYRYERGTDLHNVERAANRAAALILELAGGTLCEGVIRTGVKPGPEVKVNMRLARCKKILGIEVPHDRVVGILSRLGLSPLLGPDGVVHCKVPSHRLDLHREIDLIEEVARMHGLEHLQVAQKIHIVAKPVPVKVRARARMAEALLAGGYYETVTFSFMHPKQAAAFVPKGDEAVVVDDDRRKSENAMRPSLIPSLLICRKTNQDVGNSGLKLFETASVWSRRAGQIIETQVLGVLCDQSEKTLGIRELRGALEEMIVRLAGPGVKVELLPAIHAALEPAADVVVNGKRIGFAGLCSVATLKTFELGSPVSVAELSVPELIALFPGSSGVHQLSRFPGIERDLSIVVDEHVTWQQIEQTVAKVNPALLESVSFITTYRGKPIAAGKKSVSFRMVFRDPAVTLRHEQVDGQVDAVVKGLSAAVGAEVRS